MADSDKARHFSLFRESLVAAMVATIAATALMLGVLAVNPPTFRAVAFLRFEQPQPERIRELAYAAGDPEALTQFQASEGLTVDPAFQPPPFNRLLDRLADRSEEDGWLRVTPGDDGRTLRLFVTATDPQRAADVATALATAVLARDPVGSIQTHASAPPPIVAAVPLPAPVKAEEPPSVESTAKVEEGASRQIEAARQKAESAEADLQRFLAAAPQDQTLDRGLAEARARLAQASSAAKDAETRWLQVTALKGRPASEIIAAPAFDGDTYATLRIRHEAAAAIERALASQLLDLHPMLIDARQSLRVADEAVKSALEDVIAAEKSKVDAARRAKAQASAALAPLEIAEAGQRARKVKEQSLREAAETARAAYQAERDKPRPSATMPATPAVSTPAGPKSAPESPPPAISASPPAKVISDSVRPVVVAAAVPAQPISLKPMVLLTSAALLGAALGLLIGGVAAFVRPLSVRSGV